MAKQLAGGWGSNPGIDWTADIIAATVCGSMTVLLVAACIMLSSEQLFWLSY